MWRQTACHKLNNLALNTKKTKEVIVDFRRNKDGTHSPVHLSGEEVERVTSFKFLGVHISEDLSWTTNTSALVKKAHKRIFFLRKLAKLRLSSQVLMNLYRCTIESILSTCISVWYGNCTVKDKKSLQRVVKIAQRIIKMPLPSIASVYEKRCLRSARNIIRDSSHPNHTLFVPLRGTRSGTRYRSLPGRTNRTTHSFFPSAVRLLTMNPTLSHTA
ncbi:uncharacterized protein LOC117545361 [Gymnodraco acuticeps]|uniref:Uncharacterized protein LOC117545361 n=1 Tax=Gymnodraco acuticeps TaxID=8218 RepID=A0A6P8U2N8_GYMAC|nr:uncharacterized protein LOC117545361 [Gymnodraco acuticeps]XP_034071000.1 uncharacterized protein LOC117545361 [Gymnodraco acuticeps]